MIQMINNRWLALAELVCVGASGLLWYIWPELGWMVLFLALAPWMLRTLAGAAGNSSARFDIPMLVFLATAGVGVWAAYHREAAWGKFWLLVAGILVFYALARQPFENRRGAAWYLVLIGCLTTVYFMATQDWHADPTHFAWINTLGNAWMSVRPEIGLPHLTDYAAAGILVITTPFLPALWTQERNRFVLAVAGLLIGFGLLMTGERSAWFVLILAFIPWSLWQMVWKLAGEEQAEAVRLFWRFIRVIALIALVATLAYLFVSVIRIQGVPGLGSLVDRVIFVDNTLDLIGDFPYTGGGLRAFEGLYSHYVFAIPHVLARYSLNLYLDVTIEQGIFGGLSLIAILGGSLWLVRRPYAQADEMGKALHWATLTGLIFILAHGLVDNSLYGDRGTPFLFVLPGIALILQAQRTRAENPDDRQTMTSRRILGLPLPMVMLVFITFGMLTVGLLAGEKLAARWFSNLGAVEMAQIELADFPSDEWADGSQTYLLAGAVDKFKRALWLDPALRTGYHRLGLVALQQRDYGMAIQHLEKAYLLDPAHRGIRKNLGYSYVWAGDYQNALGILSDLPEARLELSNYSHFWRMHGRQDLAENALQMVAMLDNQQTENDG
jgi:hypothetical protein